MLAVFHMCNRSIVRVYFEILASKPIVGFGLDKIGWLAENIPTAFTLFKAFLYLLPFFHKMDANWNSRVRERNFPLKLFQLFFY